MKERSEPTFWVTIRREGEGEDVRWNDRLRVMSFEYQDEEAKTDLVKLTITNYDLSNFDNTLWAPGNTITVSWGYVGNMSRPHEAKITKVKGGVELTVEAQGKESDMNRLVKRRRFENMTRGQVAVQIAKEHGFPEAAQFVEHQGDAEETIVQSGETDAQFLRRLASIEGYEFFADVDGFHFHRRQLGQRPVKEVRWYLPEHKGAVGAVGDIIAWNVETDVYGTPNERPGKVIIKGRDPGTKESFEVTASDRHTERDALAALPLSVDQDTGADTFQQGLAKEHVHRTSQTSAAAAQREADAEYRKALLSNVELTMTLIGDPQIEAKSLIAVSGISDRLAGIYYVKSARHVISSGYTTELKLASDGVDRAAAEYGARAQGFAGAAAASKGVPNTNKAPSGTETEGPAPLFSIQFHPIGGVYPPGSSAGYQPAADEQLGSLSQFITTEPPKNTGR